MFAHTIIKCEQQLIILHIIHINNSQHNNYLLPILMVQFGQSSHPSELFPKELEFHLRANQSIH